MTSTDEAGFIRAICLDPADDLPRLVYADWLEEQASGEVCPACDGFPIEDDGHCFHCSGTGRVSNSNRERAGFIRVQVELAGLPAPPAPVYATGPAPVLGAVVEAAKRATDPHYEQRHALRRRERDLFQFHVKELLPRELDARLTLEPAMLTGPGVTALLRRGFVAHVSAPMAVLFGGERCPNDCEVVPSTALAGLWCKLKLVDEEMVWEACHTCSGTGRTSGVAAELWRSQPVERVTLTDREPRQIESGDWAWVKNTDRPEGLSGDLFKLLAGQSGEYWLNYTQSAKVYPTRAAALAAASAACVALGRERAGLPALVIS